MDGHSKILCFIALGALLLAGCAPSPYVYTHTHRPPPAPGFPPGSFPQRTDGAIAESAEVKTPTAKPVKRTPSPSKPPARVAKYTPPAQDTTRIPQATSRPGKLKLPPDADPNRPEDQRVAVAAGTYWDRVGRLKMLPGTYARQEKRTAQAKPVVIKEEKAVFADEDAPLVLSVE